MEIEQHLTALLRYDTPSLCNAMERLDVRPRNEGFTDTSIRQVVGTSRMAGVAVTARLAAQHPGDDGVAMSELFELVAATEGPPVLVVEDVDAAVGTGSILGEVTGNLFTALGVVGFVTNGAVRDLDELRGLGLSVFAHAACVSHAYVRLVEVGRPVTIGGMEVATGDIVHGDEHGILHVPRDVVAQLPEQAEAVRARELRTIAWARSDEFSVEGLVRRAAPQH
jgi:4-hydroxy-4-methyl-2-oxoglutarate aldolase